MRLPRLSMNSCAPTITPPTTTALRQRPERSVAPLPVRHEAGVWSARRVAFEEKGQAQRGLFSEKPEYARREAPAERDAAR